MPEIVFRIAIKKFLKVQYLEACCTFIKFCCPYNFEPKTDTSLKSFGKSTHKKTYKEEKLS